jgi:glyoxylase-like metal-dependent hydrolase (beta-lactamase superfamily II)
MTRTRPNELPYGGRAAQVGALTILPIFDGNRSEDPTAMYVRGERQRGDSLEDWQPYPDLLNDQGNLDHGYGGYLVETDGHLVLIDAGLGPEPIGPLGPSKRVIKGGELPAHLAALGVRPADITDVVATHLHPDHYGWATAHEGTFFPNATFHCHALDWDHFVTRADPEDVFYRHAQLLPAVADHLQLFDTDGPLLPNIDVQLVGGHTPGSTIVMISSSGERALLLGDIVHSPVELVDTAWASIGDIDPALALRVRESVAQELEAGQVLAGGVHFPGMRMGRLVRGQGRRWWVT